MAEPRPMTTMSRLYEENGVEATIYPGGGNAPMPGSAGVVSVLVPLVQSVHSPFQVSVSPAAAVSIGDVLELGGAKYVVGDAGTQSHVEKFELALTLYPANFLGDISKREQARDPETMKLEISSVLVVSSAVGFIAAADISFRMSDGGRRDHSVGDAVFPMYPGLSNGQKMLWPGGNVAEIQDLDVLSFPGSARFRVVGSNR